MSDLAIRARGVGKSYRLYNNAGDRLLDLLGLLANAKRKVRRHLALQDINFDITRGEKVAIIGRNGAGKSTLLKLITRVTEPSEGILEVHGESRALLQIGTGFHPDFTGRENVSAYLASLGVGQKRAAQLIEDSIAFAEMEDFADQPMKTYSTGMNMRLMFAASTMMKPDLLVIDEVLGVGDAYFQRKSFERIREMCESRETTLLLVTHDIYSAASLCDRMIWIDRGRILIDSDPPTVTRAYEDAVREQEERRLRLKALKAAADRGEGARKERLIVEIQSEDNQPPAGSVWFSRLTLLQDGVPLASARFDDHAFEQRDAAWLQREGANWSESKTVRGRLARALRPFGSPFHKVAAVFEIEALANLDKTAFSVAIDYCVEAPTSLRATLTSASWRAELGVLPTDANEWTAHIAACGDASEDVKPPNQFDLSNWDAWSIVTDGAIVEVDPEGMALAWHGAAGPYLLTTPPVQMTPGETLLLPIAASVRSGRLGFGALNASGQWIRTYEFEGARDAKTLEFPVDESGVVTLVLYSASPDPLAVKLTTDARAAQADASVNVRGIYGAGDIRVDRFRVLDENGRQTPVLEVGKAVSFEITYAIARDDLREQAQIVLAFKRHGVEDVLRVICRDLTFDAAAARSGLVMATLDPLPLAPGEYAITVLVAAEGYYDEAQTLYFSINPNVYFAQSVAGEITVVGASQIHQGTAVLGTAQWRMEAKNGQGQHVPTVRVAKAAS